MTSPTARSLALLRKRGYRAQVVERWNPHARIRQDLWGLDVLAIREGETLGVQATSGDNLAKRVAKVRASEALPDLLAAGWRVACWGWRKNAKGRWVVREVEVTASDLPAVVRAI